MDLVTPAAIGGHAFFQMEITKSEPAMRTVTGSHNSHQPTLPESLEGQIR